MVVDVMVYVMVDVVAGLVMMGRGRRHHATVIRRFQSRTWSNELAYPLSSLRAWSDRCPLSCDAALCSDDSDDSDDEGVRPARAEVEGLPAGVD